MDDAGLDIEDPPDDVGYIVESIVAAALMDHYVFPLSNYQGVGS